MTSPGDNLKTRVHAFWNQASCDTSSAGSAKFSRDYFEEVECFRYKDQPFIHSFAQFSRYHNKQVVEVGFGAGTDFIQWLRAGAKATGIDLTEEALENLTMRIRVYKLPAPEDIRVADAELLPFPSDHFDLGYSFGVLHHTPDTPKALAELVRVIKPGGELKVMLYNLHSIRVFRFWVEKALLRGRPWKGFRWVTWNYIESLGTKAYSRMELVKMLSVLPLRNIHVRTEVTSADVLAFSSFKPANILCRAVLRAVGCQERWRVPEYLPGAARNLRRGRNAAIEFSGNRLGFFHCVSAVKTEE